jgi:hypothetical protein
VKDLYCQVSAADAVVNRKNGFTTVQIVPIDGTDRFIHIGKMMANDFLSASCPGSECHDGRLDSARALDTESL